MKAARAVRAFGSLSTASKYGIRTYSLLRRALKGSGLQAQHIIEKRFASQLGAKASQMLSVAVTDAEHQAFTNAWRKLISYGTSAEASVQEVRAAARKI